MYLLYVEWDSSDEKLGEFPTPDAAYEFVKAMNPGPDYTQFPGLEWVEHCEVCLRNLETGSDWLLSKLNPTDTAYWWLHQGDNGPLPDFA